MNDEQWRGLLGVLAGRVSQPVPCGFVVDSPWLPGWYGVEIVEYLSSESVWFEANRKLVETFPDVWFLPGFWSEFGMCTEPSAFGARCIFPGNGFPFAEKVLLERTPDRSRLILSCAGGMPPGVTTGNIQAFISEADAMTG